MSLQRIFFQRLVSSNFASVQKYLLFAGIFQTRRIIHSTLSFLPKVWQRYNFLQFHAKFEKKCFFKFAVECFTKFLTKFGIVFNEKILLRIRKGIKFALECIIRYLAETVFQRNFFRKLIFKTGTFRFSIIFS